MKRPAALGLTRFAAMLVLILQALLPGMMAGAAPKHLDLSHYLCAPSGELSPELRAGAERIAKLLGEAPPGEPHSGEHCPMCTLAQGAHLPEPVMVDLPVTFARDHVVARFKPGLIREAQGPPLGSRGPPAPV